MKTVHPHVLLLILIVLLCAYLRLYHLETNPLWYTDESNFVDSAYNLAGGELRMQAVKYPFATEMHPHPPLFFLLNGIALHLAGKNMLGARLLSALMAVAAVIPVFLIGARLADRRVGLLAALLFAMHFYSMLFTRWGMPYNVSMFFNILALERLSRAATDRVPGALYAAAGFVGLSCVTSFYALPLVFVILVFSLRSYRSHTAPAVAVAIVPFALFLVWGTALRGVDFLRDFIGLFYQITPEGTGFVSQGVVFLKAALRFVFYDWIFLLGVVGLAFWRGRGRLVMWYCAALLVLILKKQGLDPSVKYNAPVYLYCIHLGAAWGIVRIFDNLLDAARPYLKNETITKKARVCLALFMAVPLVFYGQARVREAATVIHSDYDKYYGSVKNIPAAYEMADFVNSITESDDIVIAPERCYWLIECKTANLYQAVAASGLPTTWHKNIAPERFAYDCSLQNATLVVLDATDTGLILRSGNPNMDSIPQTLVREKWPRIAEIGEYQVFRNPGME